jgi:hypothetical protein
MTKAPSGAFVIPGSISAVVGMGAARLSSATSRRSSAPPLVLFPTLEALGQLADMVAGALNRRLNAGEARNHKDEITDMVIERLGLALEGERRDAALDAAMMFNI